MSQNLKALREECWKSENFLRAKRREMGLSQKAVAEQLGISAQAYGHYENGKRALPIEFVIPLSEMLEVDIETLVREYINTST